MNKISIIVPVYNSQQHLEQCIESLVNQSYRNIEILLVDDGSTDGSLEIIENFAQHDQRIKVIVESNLGVAAARNTGLDHVTGDYICFVNSDDFVGKDYCQHLLNLCLKGNVEVAIGEYNYIDTRTSKYMIVMQPDPNDPQYNGVFTSQQWLENIDEFGLYNPLVNVLWGKIFKSSLFENIRFPINHKLDEDIVVIYQLILKADSIAFSNYRDYIYRDYLSPQLHNQYDANYSLCQTYNQQITMAKLCSFGDRVVHKFKSVYQDRLKALQKQPAFRNYANQLLKIEHKYIHTNKGESHE